LLFHPNILQSVHPRVSFRAIFVNSVSPW